MTAENELKIVKQLACVDESQIEINETGWTSRLYIINGGKIVFKFPRNVKFREECKQEIAVLKLIKEQNFSLSIPVLNWVAEDNSYFGFYGVEGKPLGTVINELSKDQKVEIGTQLGKFLKQLHSIKNYGNIKIQTLEEQAEEYQDWYRKDRDLLKDFFSESQLKKIDNFFTIEVPKCMTGTGELVFCHGDLDYNNTLIDAENRVGIIDFGDARLYDRSQDFRGIDDHLLREAMIKAYGGGEIISKDAAVATSKMIDVLNMLYCIEQKNPVGINDYLKRIKSKILMQ
ncbi:aminoglycoside phosphotransferase family protein [Bacteroides sp. 224]|uniref:aminoglycoside phosphotransferase family protein n=1 Tax=Bacteroides sp. 224 TaxID=2302936 RepID=UPI0013CF5DC2|nr:aminoglycoside phosphotransferase family protein [Bacteroides sp. 224]NDV66763.1 aminoglycoside phosphotransferase family protein [Bacteroides sp. 224]